MNNPIPSEPVLATLAERMRWVVGASSASSRELDRLAKRTEGHAQAISAGTITNPTRETIRAYATTTGCPVGWLLEGEGDAPAPEDVRAAVERARASQPAATVTEAA